MFMVKTLLQTTPTLVELLRVPESRVDSGSGQVPGPGPEKKIGSGLGSSFSIIFVFYLFIGCSSRETYIPES